MKSSPEFTWFRRTVALTLCTVSLLMAAIQPAFSQIAPGATQSAAQTANITGRVTGNDGAPIAGADIELTGSARRSTKSDERGTFAFTSVSWGTYQIAARFRGRTVSRNNITLNNDISVTIAFPPESELRTIGRVSTSNAGVHINTSSSSVDSISPSDAAFQGEGTWKHVFDQIPGVATSGNESNGLSGVTSVVGSPLAPVILSLNGALPYETSTTLDGMPLQGISSTLSAGGGVDLSTLPLNAFSTADVVRGPGANAPSIVDSVGGSFVLHTLGAVNANHFEFSASNDPYGGSIENAKIALRFGKLSATLVYGINNSPGPLGTKPVLGGLSTPTAINGQVVNLPTATYNVNGCGIANSYCSTTNTLLYSSIPQSTAWTAHNGAVDLVYDVTPAITAEAFHAASSAMQSAQYGFFPVSFAPSSNVPAYSGSIQPSPAGQTNYALMQTQGLAMDSQASSLFEEKVTASIGAGVLRLAALQYYSYNSEPYSPQNPPSGEYTLWGTANVGTPGTTTVYNGTPASLLFPNEYLSSTNNSISRDILASYATQIGSSSSVGVSYVKSYYDSPGAGALYFSGAPLFTFSQGSDIAESTSEIRTHINTDIGDKLSLGLSWYFAHGDYHVPGLNAVGYTDVSFPYNAPRFGAVWKASPDVALRASAGGGYALPVLYNLTGSSLTCQPTLCNESIANPNIKPEESFGYDIGSDVRLHRDTLLSADLYLTNLYGQFFDSYAESTYNGLPLFISQFANLGTSRMEGVNLTAKHDVASGYYWNADLGLTRAYVVSVPSALYDNPTVPCIKCANQSIVPGLNFNSSAGYLATVPYATASAGFGYRWSPGRSIDLQSNYYGNNNAYFEPAFVGLNAHIAYAFNKRISLLATFKNITGAYDESVAHYYSNYANPVIPGAVGPFIYPAPYSAPYGPRAVILTASLGL